MGRAQGPMGGSWYADRGSLEGSSGRPSALPSILRDLPGGRQHARMRASVHRFTPTSAWERSETMSKVLVTGGAGFIGANLLRQIDSSYEVRVLDNLVRGQRELLPGDRDIELVVGDI